MVKREELNGKFCIVKGCGKPLKGRQRKYCSLKCRKFSDKHRNRHYYLKYHAERSKRIRVLDELKKVCVVCGAKLGKYKRLYCGEECKKIARSNDHVNPNWYPLEQAIPDKCDECGSKHIIRDGHDIVCKTCGLVME